MKFLAVASAVAGFHCADLTALAQCQYEVTAVIQHPGCTPPFTSSSLTATALNNLGHVTGYYVNCVTLRDEGFIWTPEGGLVTMTRPPGVVEIQPEDINDHGVVVGSWWTTDPLRDRRGFVYWPDTQTYTELDTLSGAGWSMAHAINNNNVVVGERATEEKAAPRIAFVWTQKNGFVDIGYPTYESSIATDVSDNGIVVGAIHPTLDAFTWHDGVLNLHGRSAGASYTEFRAIGISGDLTVVGFSEVENLPKPILWNNTFTYLPLLPSHNIGRAVAIRNHPIQIGGFSRKLVTNPHIDEFRATVWTANDIYNLNDWTIGATLALTQVSDINASGVILVTTSGPQRYLLTPIYSSPADLSGDCRTDHTDLLLLLEQWNQKESFADLDKSGRVNVFDLFLLLRDWTG